MKQEHTNRRTPPYFNENEVSFMEGERYPSSDRRIPKTLLPAQTPALAAAPQADTLTFTWLGHSSFLLQIGSRNVLVDPILSSRASPVQLAGPKRFSALPLTADALPKLDVVFVSHDHYDHLDKRTICAIRDRAAAFIVPLGVDDILTGWGVDASKITALDWWEHVEIDGVTYTLTPGQHFTGRNPFKRNVTLWGGLYLDSGTHRVYYTGDGGYYDVFRRIRARLGAPDLMIGECGQYDPLWSNIHMFPEQTAQAGLDVGAKWLIPVHWGSFCICNHAWDDSIRRVTAAAEAAGLSVATPMIGQTAAYSTLSACTERWWEAYA